ncbi:MAG: hypothetical protein AAFX05_13910 [Planctomycetota bacterium]
MPQETKSHDAASEQKKGEERPSLQGLIATRDDEQALLDALEQAFDYRGDVTVVRTDGASFTGYIFDRRTANTLDASNLRLLPQDSDDHVTIRYSEIAQLEFSGKDMAHGKTFERWIERFIEKKLKGESAGIESEPLD